MRLYHWLGGITIVLLVFNCQSIRPTHVETKNYSIEENQIGKDSVILGIIAPYERQIKAVMEEVIGMAQVALTLEKPESTLGNWIIDLLFDASKKYYSGQIDFAILNYGGIRLQSIPKGAIRRSKIFELMPFNNFWVVVEVDGKTVQQLLNTIAADGGWPISKHLRFKIKSGQADDISIDGMPLKLDKKYMVAMPDFIANGGGHCDFLEHKMCINTNQMVRDIIIDQIIEFKQEVSQWQVSKDGRLIIE